MDNINNIAGTHNSAVDILLFAILAVFVTLEKLILGVQEHVCEMLRILSATLRCYIQRKNTSKS
jgi:hypothetical protein